MLTSIYQTGITSQKTVIFVVTALGTWTLMEIYNVFTQSLREFFFYLKLMFVKWMCSQWLNLLPQQVEQKYFFHCYLNRKWSFHNLFPGANVTQLWTIFPCSVRYLSADCEPVLLCVLACALGWAKFHGCFTECVCSTMGFSLAQGCGSCNTF
jgi:hypothetical protein